MSLTQFRSPYDSPFVTALDSEIPIVNIGGSIRGRFRQKPKEVYIRGTYEVLSSFLSTEDGRQKLLKWLQIAVLNGLDNGNNKN